MRNTKSCINRYLFIGAIAVLTLACLNCSLSDKFRKPKYIAVDYTQAKQMLGSETPPTVIDVRTPQEFTGELGHIPGARLIPVQVIADSLNAIADMKDKDILLVCRVGNRSARAAQILVDAGFNRVYHLDGGMVAWNENRGPVEH